MSAVVVVRRKQINPVKLLVVFLFGINLTRIFDWDMAGVVSFSQPRYPLPVSPNGREFSAQFDLS